MANPKGNPRLYKGCPPLNPSGRPKEALSLGKEVVAALRDAFHEGGGKDWLLEMMQNEPKTFAALLAKVIPQDINASVTHTVIDLRQAVDEANKRLEQAGLKDVTPNTLEHKQDAIVLDATSETDNQAKQAKPLKTKGK